MPFSQKIFFKNKALILTENAESYIQAFPKAADCLYLKGCLSEHLDLVKKHLNNPAGTEVLLEIENLETAKKELSRLFKPISAAGGLVLSPEGKILMIFRSGKWDLPKGKLEPDEDIETCALREVREETGLPENIRADKEICRSYHVYERDGAEILKTTYWFDMKAAAAYPLQPQTEEDIQEAVWVNPNELSGYLKKTWETIKEVFRAAGFS